jgi:propanol-preferring alcohol dehydrogenase
MKAVRYHGPNRPLQLEEVPIPEPGPGEILLRVRASGICHTELHFLSGLLNLGIAPLTLGHEIVGVVESVGPSVEEPREGDRVIVDYYSGCGRCEHCRRGDENLCSNLRSEYGFISDGEFAEYIAVPARNTVPLPPTISDEEAAPIGCGVTTAVHAGRLAGLRMGETVLVYGVGTVGYDLVQLGRLAGATVIAVGRTDRKLDLARELGADFAINAGRESVTDRVREITGGRGADVVFELVATRETMGYAVEGLAKRGRLVFIGYSEDPLTVHPVQLVIKEASVTGSVGNTLDELHQAVRLVGHGKIKTVVDRTLPLDRFQEGIDALSAGELVGRAVLTPGAR